jgi:hypothetical protein
VSFSFSCLSPLGFLLLRLTCTIFLSCHVMSSSYMSPSLSLFVSSFLLFVLFILLVILFVFFLIVS